MNNLIMKEIKRQGVFRTRICIEAMEECIFKFLIEKYNAERFVDNKFLEGSDIDNFFEDNIRLRINYNDDVAININPILEKLEQQLRLDKLITEDSDFRATNLCIKAIEHDLGIESKKIDVWRDDSIDYLIIQIPTEILNN